MSTTEPHEFVAPPHLNCCSFQVGNGVYCGQRREAAIHQVASRPAEPSDWDKQPTISEIIAAYDPAHDTLCDPDHWNSNEGGNQL